MPSLSDILSYILVAILAFFGLIFLVASAVDPVHALPGFSFLVVAGLLLYLTHRVKEVKASEEKLEAAIIRLAKRKGGFVSIADVSSELNLPIDTARRLLEGLERKGVAFLDFKKIGDEGVEVYRILGASEGEEKG
ncbi:MAG: hypothetical protein NZ992_01170 [Candidatus Korarchaeum sp.]|nr:hypothetical protein [Candidatus Korarchaeum sp.]